MFVTTIDKMSAPNLLFFARDAGRFITAVIKRPGRSCEVFIRNETLYLDSIGSEPLRFRLDQLVPGICPGAAQDRAAAEIATSLSRRQNHDNHSIEPRKFVGSAENISFSKSRKAPVHSLVFQAAGDAFGRAGLCVESKVFTRI
jgi:hypothetical protein